MTEKYEASTEEEIPAIVQRWISGNPEFFNIEGNTGYRQSTIDGMKRYLHSPTKYLETRLKTLPDAIKWYFQALQIILFTGLLGVVLILIKTSVDNIVSTSIFTTQRFNWIQDSKWMFPLIVALGIFGIRDRIVVWIQRAAKIRMNFREIDIEIFYITKILETRAHQTRINAE